MLLRIDGNFMYIGLCAWAYACIDLHGKLTAQVTAFGRQPMCSVLPSNPLASTPTAAMDSLWRFRLSGTPARKKSFPEQCWDMRTTLIPPLTCLCPLPLQPREASLNTALQRNSWMRFAAEIPRLVLGQLTILHFYSFVVPTLDTLATLAIRPMTGKCFRSW